MLVDSSVLVHVCAWVHGRVVDARNYGLRVCEYLYVLVVRLYGDINNTFSWVSNDLPSFLVWSRACVYCQWWWCVWGVYMRLCLCLHKCMGLRTYAYAQVSIHNEGEAGEDAREGTIVMGQQ